MCTKAFGCSPEYGLSGQVVETHVRRVSKIVSKGIEQVPIIMLELRDALVSAQFEDGIQLPM